MEGPINILTRLPNRSLKAVKMRAHELRLHFEKKWSEEEYQVLREHYPTKGQAVVAMRLGRTRSSVKCAASRLGLKVNSDTWQALSDNNAYKGCQDISQTHWKAMRNSAVQRNIDFDITIERAWEIYESQGRLCALSGLPIEFAFDRFAKNGTASLDRIDSSEGYVEGNVQWVHKHINLMKWKLPQQDFINYCHKIVALHPKSL
mgnify:CR=1 FL=1